MIKSYKINVILQENITNVIILTIKKKKQNKIIDFINNSHYKFQHECNGLVPT